MPGPTPIPVSLRQTDPTRRRRGVILGVIAVALLLGGCCGIAALGARTVWTVAGLTGFSDREDVERDMLVEYPDYRVISVRPVESGGDVDVWLRHEHEPFELYVRALKRRSGVWIPRDTHIAQSWGKAERALPIPAFMVSEVGECRVWNIETDVRYLDGVYVDAWTLSYIKLRNGQPTGSSAQLTLFWDDGKSEWSTEPPASTE